MMGLADVEGRRDLNEDIGPCQSFWTKIGHGWRDLSIGFFVFPPRFICASVLQWNRQQVVDLWVVFLATRGIDIDKGLWTSGG